MREKPVPVRVEKESNSNDESTPMDEAGMEASEREKVKVCEEQQDIKDLPSMVPIVPLNKPIVFDVHNIGMFQQSFQLKAKFESPEEFEFLEKESVSESQKQAVKFGVRVFRDWFYRQGSTLKSLEDMSRQEIASALEQFYLTARRPNGTQYKKNTLKSIKHSLDLYLRSSPLKKDFSISSDFDFREVNRTLDNLPEDADNNRFPQCTRETILKLYKAGQLGLVTTEDPQVLIQTVWFYIACHFFSNIDKRMLRELTGSMLVLTKDESGQEYYWLDYKTPDRCRADIRKSHICAKAGSLCCPVAIIKKYLEHRNPRNEVLFQHPKKISNAIWYSHLPLGKNKHMDIIKVMCVNAGIDPPLTGRCIRSYVQELLRDVDEVVNSMFQLGGVTSLPPGTLQTVILPKVPGSMDQTPVHQIAHSGPHFAISKSALVPITRTSPVNATTVQEDHVAGSCSGTMTTNTVDSAMHSNGFENGIVAVPYGNGSFLGYPSMNDKVPMQKRLNHYKDIYPSAHVSPGIPGVMSNMLRVSPQYGHITLDQRSVAIEAGEGQCFATPSSTETATQTDEPGDKECPQSAYNKADLKTKNRMRLQARKSLLSFLEELNEISDGHGTELFHEIVQEDMNMWKSIAQPMTK